MSELPYMKFFPTDWLSDCHVLSLAARGAWQTIICKAWHPSTRGVVTLKLSAWARLFGATVEQAEKVIAEIEETKVADVLRDLDNITITSRRSVKDWEAATNRQTSLSEGGRKGAEKRWGGHGLANGQANARPIASQKPEARSQKEEESAAGKPARADVSTDELFLTEITRHYPDINVQSEIRKMQAWLLTPRGQGKKLTRQRIISWLNRCDAPVKTSPGANSAQKRAIPDRSAIDPSAFAEWGAGFVTKWTLENATDEVIQRYLRENK